MVSLGMLAAAFLATSFTGCLGGEPTSLRRRPGPAATAARRRRGSAGTGDTTVSGSAGTGFVEPRAGR